MIGVLAALSATMLVRGDQYPPSNKNNVVSNMFR